jgi:hypothetical protein
MGLPPALRVGAVVAAAAVGVGQAREGAGRLAEALVVGLAVAVSVELAARTLADAVDGATLGRGEAVDEALRGAGVDGGIARRDLADTRGVGAAAHRHAVVGGSLGARGDTGGADHGEGEPLDHHPVELHGDLGLRVETRTRRDGMLHGEIGCGRATCAERRQ